VELVACCCYGKPSCHFDAQLLLFLSPLAATIVVGLFSFVAIFLLADLGEALKERFPILDCSAKNEDDEATAAGNPLSLNGDGSDAAGSGYQLVAGAKGDEEA
jgi:hypothetical protein